MSARDLEPSIGPVPSFDHRVSSTGDAVVLDVTGDVDFTTSVEFHLALHGLVESSTAPVVVVDLSGVRLIDAAAIRVLVEAHAAATARGRCLYVDGLEPLPAQVFDILRLDWLRLPDSKPSVRQSRR